MPFLLLRSDVTLILKAIKLANCAYLLACIYKNSYKTHAIVVIVLSCLRTGDREAPAGNGMTIPPSAKTARNTEVVTCNNYNNNNNNNNNYNNNNNNNNNFIYTLK